MDTRNKLFVIVGTVAILGTAGAVGALLFTQKDSATNDSTTTTTQSETSTSSSSGTTTTASTYEDGTYTTTTKYQTPHGDTNSLKVSVTLSSGTIAAVTATTMYNDDESAEYADSFESSVSDVIVGQEIGSTPSSRIGGASLTSAAFYDALDTIATQAQV